MTDKSIIKCASFFTGIGGFDKGFEKAGIEAVFQCEIDKYCLSVLNKHWPNVKKNNDIKELNPLDIPSAELWCGGFPCQDVSVARGWLGRDGLKGQNTGLFFPFANLIKERLPQVIIMENVSGLLSSHDGKDFAVILHALHDLGYGVAWRTLNARYFGVPQSRPRVFICAWKKSAESAYHVLFEEGECMEVESPRLGFLRASICEKTGARVPEVSFCLAATSGRHTGTDWSRSYVAYDDEVRRLTPTECERIQGYPDNWSFPNKDFNLSSDKIDSLRYKAIGNAVSVPVIEWIGKRLVNEFNNFSHTKSNITDNNIDRFGKYTPGLTGQKSNKLTLPDISGHQDAPKIKWFSAGVMENLNCIMGSVAHLPQKPIASFLVDALDEHKPSERYFLSPNAAEGIMRRVNSQGRQLFPPLAEALDKLRMQY